MNIAFIAHDKKKDEMVRLTTAYREIIKEHQIFATGTTGQRIIDATGLNVHRFKSGPLGGDQQIGAYVSDNKIDLVIFLRDPLTPQPHEPDISALLRLCDVYEIPLATNLGTSEVLLRGLGSGFIEWRKTQQESQLKGLEEFE
ncbi:methylglyoxal synthase [Carnobacterium pleistocenium]|uniref:methylglyoxal synthase n=1 Tax=Carnobacterium pleistocenium TaxID=181073 RepID=UPI0005570FA4|nr:methylglyoxal synthase [Carnobacterium pleistocenium]